MAKFTTTFALLFACLLGTSMFFQMAEAGKKKRKIVKLLLLAASLIKKPKILPLPLPIPIPVRTAVLPETR